MAASPAGTRRARLALMPGLVLGPWAGGRPARRCWGRWRGGGGGGGGGPCLLSPIMLPLHCLLTLLSPCLHPPLHLTPVVVGGQDSTYVALDPPDVVTVWLALTPASPANGCLHFQAGSHLGGQLAHVDTRSPGNLLLKGQTIPVGGSAGSGCKDGTPPPALLLAPPPPPRCRLRDRHLPTAPPAALQLLGHCLLPAARHRRHERGLSARSRA